MRTAEPYRYGCASCGSVSLASRTRLDGYRCQACGHIMDRGDRVDRAEQEVATQEVE